MAEETQTAAVCAVVVTYRAKQAKLEKLLQGLGSTVRHVIVVDNGSPGLDRDRLATSYPWLLVETLPYNKGIAAAQNEGIRLAARTGMPFVLLLDQDSDPLPDMVCRLVAACEQLNASGNKVACVGPQLRMRGGGTAPFFPRPGWGGVRRVRCRDGGEPVECEYLIASGSLIPVEIFKHVGNLEEPLFIDHVDTEWCYRARSKGYRIFGVCGAILEHELGTIFHRVWVIRWRRIARHNPLRYYYIFRNVLLLSQRSYVPLSWRTRQYAWLCALFVAFGLMSGLRSSELSMMLKGMWHGIRGITGKLEDQRGAA